LDFEANPRFKLGATTVAMRHRFEWRWLKGRGGGTDNRFRQEVGLSWPTRLVPGLRSFGVRNEWFYDFQAERVNQNRFYPVVFNFEVTPRFRVSAGWQIVSSYAAGTRDWSHFDVTALSGSVRF
jgi:hypothetical protein